MEPNHTAHEHGRRRHGRNKSAMNEIPARVNHRRAPGPRPSRREHSAVAHISVPEWDVPMQDEPLQENGIRGRLKTAATSLNATSTSWLQRGARVVDLLRVSAPGLDDEIPGASLAGVGHLGTLISTLDWDNVRAEVDQESCARFVIAGASNTGKSTLINYLKGTPLSTPALEREEPDGAAADTTIEDIGLFTLIDVMPGHADGARSSGEQMAWDAIHAADLVLWVLDGNVGLRAWEHEWICRIRASGKPLLVVLNKLDQIHDANMPAQIRQTLACPIICISARDGAHVATELLPAIANASPALNTALGRELPAWRHAAVQRVTQRAAMLSAFVGVEPLPLLDIPFQALIQLRLVLRVAAIYDEPHGDRYSRELLTTLVSSMALRYAGQQLAKFVPVLGWLASSLLAGGGAWVIGMAAERYFSGGRRLTLPHVKLPRFKVIKQ